MLFQYRHMLAVLFCLMILAAGYVFDLSALQDNYKELIENQNELRQPQTASQEKSVNARRIDKSQQIASRLQSEFLNMSAVNQAMLESVTKVDVPPNASTNDEYYQLSLSSSFQGLIGFLQRIDQSSSHFLLRRISIQAGHHGLLQTDIVFRASVSNINHGNATSIEVKNSFCEMTNSISDRQESTDQLKLFELSKLTLLGTINKTGKTSAIILFPNGVIKEVASNMKLGKEQGAITEILPDKVIIKLPSHQTYQLKTE